MIAPPVSAQKPCAGVRRVIFEPIVWTIRQPPNSVPSAIAAWQDSTTQNGTWNSPPQHALRIEQHGDDPHRLLRVVAAMAERIERGGDQLELAEALSTPSGVSWRQVQATISTSTSASIRPIAGDSEDRRRRS